MLRHGAARPQELPHVSPSLGLPHTVTAEGLELTFATNFLGAFLLTNLLLGKDNPPSPPAPNCIYLKILYPTFPLPKYVLSIKAVSKIILKEEKTIGGGACLVQREAAEPKQQQCCQGQKAAFPPSPGGANVLTPRQVAIGGVGCWHSRIVVPLPRSQTFTLPPL